MLAILPYCLRDYYTALDLLNWIKELGGCPNHDLVLIHDARCQKSDVAAILGAAQAAFRGVHDYEAKANVDGWPQGANYFFKMATSLASYQTNLKHFLWLEPDVVPLKPEWLDAIEREYLRCGLPFMGDRVEVKIEGKEVPLHMSGVGVYPNPIYEHAGEAYRAADEAWDMCARHQIVPKAHFTKLIEHAWKHPEFTDPRELETQIRPEAVLFHSSKDGSLIRLLRGRAAAARLPHKQQAEGSSPSPATTLESAPGTRPTEATPGQLPGDKHEVNHPQPQAQAPITDIFIRTYEGDYPWLKYCVEAIEKFAQGFRKVWIISPHNPPAWMLEHVMSGRPAKIEISWRTMNDESPDGYLAQQITKLYADVITDYTPDYILHIDSDVILSRPMTPLDFFLGGKLLWYYTPYSSIQTPWQPITEKFIGGRVLYEFMRRLPMMIPRWLYAKLREFCYQTHGMIISDYIRNQPQRAFSEFNAIGAYAWINNQNLPFKDTITFRTTGGNMPAPFARQFRSWDGITEETRREIESILSGAGQTQQPETTTGLPTVETCPEIPIPPGPVSPKIKELPNGIWVLEGDQISQWVEECGHLDHDQNFLPKILPHIKKGDVVIDVGAYIGDHTIAYSVAAGPTGHVMAFEPNHVAARCLVHNTELLGNVAVYERLLGDSTRKTTLSGNNGNWGGCYVGNHMPVGKVQEITLDQLQTSPDFIKIDVEGYELKVLRGAENTIMRCKPRMVIEINAVALDRQNSTAGEIVAWLKEHGYEWSIMQENCSIASPMYDILCLPVEETQGASPPSDGEPKLGIAGSPPQATLSVGAHIAALVTYARQGKEQTKYLRKQLRKYGIIPKTKTKKDPAAD